MEKEKTARPADAGFHEIDEHKPTACLAAWLYPRVPAFRGFRAVIKNDDLPPGRNRLDKSALAGKNGPPWLSRFEPGKRPAHGCTFLVGDKEDTSEACSKPQQGRHTNARVVYPRA